MIRRPGPFGRAISCSTKESSWNIKRYSTQPGTKQHDPLNILFCGADEFSIYSLRALRALQQTRPDKVVSIDVLCRTDKRVGRGLKHIQQVPIKGVAAELDLQLHQIDTFKNWQAPPNINLVVAVSFGLLVPGSLLTAAKYGGLNNHPSLLPMYRGSAPIQRTLLDRQSMTGVTLQTMHPTRFDHGVILSRTITPITKERRTDRMIDLLGPIGAKLLVDGIEAGVFVPPYPSRKDIGVAHPASCAPKITSEDRHIDWDNWTADEILLREEVLGGLWDTVTHSRCHDGWNVQGPIKRVTFKGPWEVLPLPEQSPRGFRPGFPVLSEGRNSKVGLTTMDGQIVYPQEITIEGEAKTGGQRRLAQVLQRRKQAE